MRARHRDAVAATKDAALAATESAQALLHEYRTILAATLNIDDRLDWHSLMDDRPFSEAKPKLTDVEIEHGVPGERPFVERRRKSVRERRETLNESPPKNASDGCNAGRTASRDTRPIRRTIHEVLEGDYAGHCALVVFNGIVEDVDRATGKDFRACILSCQAERDEFEAIDLARVDPRACFRALKSLSGSRLASMQPVRPLRVLDKEDPRFIEAEGVLEGLEADQNLMTMEWQDFEILVRDLFNEMFTGRGGEVKVTRTSRDQGVDAVVFDPDPLMGGKTVIQAKRYRNAVPVAAVRELFGTMMNEGAGKGILVTTSHFGASALEFAKDKPLTLIDGANLLHYLQNHGHNVRIDLAEAPEELLSD